MRIIPYPEDLESAVGRFNRRLVDSGKGEFTFPKSHRDRNSHAAVSRAYFVAVDDSEEVRGGYILRKQPFLKREQPFEHSFLKLPVSEGVINGRYASVGIELLQDVSKRSPSTFALGMGGIQNPLPKILRQLGWRVVEVPFFCKIRRALPVLGTLEPFRRSRLRRFAADTARYTGLAQYGVRLLQPSVQPPPHVRVQVEAGFESWCDRIWSESRGDYGLIAERSSATLPILYEPFSKDIRILRIIRDDTTIGWTTCLLTVMRDHRHFGDLTVATIADGLAPIADVPDVVRASVSYLESRRPDLILSNQANLHWQSALRDSGFRNGPSNFAWATSPAVAGEFSSDPDLGNTSHINRGDGDGPIHL